MTTFIPARHHPRLIKLVELYFKMQSIQVPQYVLLPDVPYADNQLDLTILSDRYDHFLSCCVYLTSTNIKTNQSFTSLLVTGSKIETEIKYEAQRVAAVLLKKHMAYL